MSNEAVKIIFGLLGGLAIFIYGMNLMSEGLQKAAGEKMRSILGILTKNPVIGVLAGDAMRLAGALPVFSTLGFAVCQRGCAEGVECVVHAKGAGFASVV